ncbi:MAG: hypothetical protein NTZ59_02390 [Bacteroidetes bacterium]|nr:hypothetical protein [Bacteroidota bacterium]
MNHKKIIIGLVAFLIIAVVILFITKAKQAKKVEDKAGTQPAATPQAATTHATPQQVLAVANGFPIMYMKKSEAAKILQNALGVAQDGIVGDKTLAELKKYVNVPSNTLWIINNTSELDLLIAKIKTVKAGGSATIVTAQPSWMQFK